MKRPPMPRAPHTLPSPLPRTVRAVARSLAILAGCTLLTTLPLSCSDKEAPRPAADKTASTKPGKDKPSKPAKAGKDNAAAKTDDAKGGKKALRAAKEANPGAAPKASVTPRAHEPKDVRELATTETSLGKLLPDFVPATAAVSPDARRVGYATVDAERTRIIVDGKEGPSGDKLGPTGIVFSRDGRHVACSLVTGDVVDVYLDGEKLGSYWGLGSSGFTFSPNGEHLAFVAARDGKQFVVLDGKEGEHYEGIGGEGIVFSADGRHHAYSVQREGKRGLVVDGKLGPLHDAIGVEGFRLSEDGSTWAYAALDGQAWTVVVNGKPGEAFPKIADLTLSSDGKHVAYRAFPSDDEAVVVVDGKRSPSYAALGPESPVLSPDGAHVAYSAIRDGKQFVVVDGKEGPPFEPGRQVVPVFSEDGDHVAYIGRGADKSHSVYLDDQLVAEYPFIIKKTLRFAPGSKNLFFMAKRDEKFFSVLGGQESPAYANVVRSSDLCSPNGARAAFLVHLRDREEFAVVDGAEGDSYDHIVPATAAFTPDSRHLTFVANKAGEQLVVVHGVGRTRGYTSVLGQGALVFDGPDKGRFLAIRDGEVFLVELSLAEG